MHYKITVSRAVFMSFAVVLLVLISLVCLAPLWHVLMGSLSNPTQVGITQGLILYPLQNLDTHAYSIILTYQRLWNGYLNTFIYIFLQCVLTGVATIVAGYVFSRNRFRFRNTFMLIISSTMLFNGGMIPMYMVVRSLGLLDTRWAIVVPGMLSVFNIIIMRTAMQGISDALEEAARFYHYVSHHPTPLQIHLCGDYAVLGGRKVERLHVGLNVSAHPYGFVPSADGTSGYLDGE